jgi:benzoyl-CoA reductase subunit B
MRPEIKEYNFDYLLNGAIDAAAKIADGTDKEYKRHLKYIPYFKDVVEPILEEGETGIIFLKGLSQYLNNVISAKERGNKVAITTFCFSPAIFYAMGIQPITLEIMTTLGAMIWKRGTFDYLDFGVEIGFTETSCSSQRGSLGAYLAGLGVDIDLIVCDSPGVCDTNANAFAFASAYLDKPMYQLNYPQTLMDDKTKQYHVDDYKELIKFLEKETGNKLEEDKLRMILKKIHRQDEILEEMEDLQRLTPNPMPPLYNLFLYAGRFIFAGTDEYTTLLETMLKTIRKNAEEKKSGLKSGVEKIRALFVYIDHYTVNLEFFKWLDDNGISHVGNILSRFYSENAPYRGDGDVSYKIDTANMDTMIDSIAQMNALMPMVRSIRGPYDAPEM